MSRRAALCLVSLAFAACHRTTGPDENYQRAAALYQQLYATQLDDAYGDPRMDEVVALLRKVDGRSVDAGAAKTMLGAIEHGREALAKERAEREKLSSAATAPAARVSIDPQAVLAANAEDAGTPTEQDPYGPGASIAELNTQTGGCLVDNEPFNEQVTGKTGTVYRLAPSEACRNKLPGMAGQAVLVSEGKIYRRIPDPRPPEPPRPAAAPDAGAPAAAARPRAAPPAQSQDAGEPEYRIVIPGAPQPGATPPPAEGQPQ
ncbi:MAG TPA: hypothetical protein VIR81_16235 [Myxococcales bacterium]|nr:hypothetical protein [Myxococcales bacterium]